MWPFATRGSRFLGDAATRSPSAMAGTDFNDNDRVAAPPSDSEPLFP